MTGVTTTAAEMAALTHHPDWADGRTGFLFCRFDAIVDAARYWRAEITWNDDGSGPESAAVYDDPMLTLETNRPVNDGGSVRWQTVDKIDIPVADNDEVRRLLAQPPAALAAEYRNEFEKLKQMAVAK